MIKLFKNLNDAKGLTHSGVFHADEVMASVILNKAINDFSLCRVSKVPDDIPEETVVYDIGGGKYDHHKIDDTKIRANGVKYAAAGLIWKDYAKYIIPDGLDWNYVFNYIEKNLIQAIDAHDNGQFNESSKPYKEVSFSAIIQSMNSNWDSNQDGDDLFKKAYDFAEVVFENYLSRAISSAKAVGLVEEYIENSSDNILILEQYLPWKDILFSSKNKKAKNLLYVIYKSNREGYVAAAVPVEKESFISKKSFPKSWRGLNSSELKKETGVDTAIFCHSNGFMFVAGNLEDAIKIAKISIDSIE